MKQLHVLGIVLKRTGAVKIWLVFLIELFACAAIILLSEPQIHTYGDALWYCYAVVTTMGFGDVIAQTTITRIISVVLSVSAVIVIAIVTGVIVNFYNQMTDLRNKETISAFINKLERLPELSKEELEDMSRKVREFQKK